MKVEKKKVVLDVLRSPCVDIETHEESEVVIRMLEVVLTEKSSFTSVAAPEANILKRAAIIRTPEFSIDLINPIILTGVDKVLSFSEKCISFDESVNCLRWSEITIENGLKREKLTLSGLSAILVQHEIDHLEGKVFFDRAIKMAVVREGGKIKLSGHCPCGSGKVFSTCCMKG